MDPTTLVERPSKRLPLALPAGVVRIAEAVRAAGGRPFLVGGAVRDALLGIPLSDYDLEVFGLDARRLKATLAEVGTVNAVGEAFTVFKVGGLTGVAGEVDVSLPRRDSKVGTGHRGIEVRGDPFLPLTEASRRRDFTINAMLLDAIAFELFDPHGGQPDLAARRLRAVDGATFAEDPLRALRAAQLAARFELEVVPETACLCAAMPIGELPAERVLGEIEKLLLRAARPSLGLRLLHDWGLLSTIAPELIPLADTPQDPGWHPEGDVWTHTLMVVDAAAATRDDLPRPQALALMLGALCHDLGKPSTTREEDGRIRSRGHEEAGIEPTLAFLDRLRVHTLCGYPVRAQVLAMVAHHLKPGQLYDSRESVSDGAIRRLAARCDPELLYRVARADCVGRAGGFPPVAQEWFRERVAALEAHKPTPPLLRGRDLLEMGLPPGPRVGEVLRAVYERQLDGEVQSLEAARELARRVLEKTGG
jgi:tRNA nucleotidyltransferase (CCA-adding enzyme)